MPLLLLPQRYIFSSKSQPATTYVNFKTCCCCYHKGTYFQANHNRMLVISLRNNRCCCYHKGTYFQANHNSTWCMAAEDIVVVATTKVHIFKQITTCDTYLYIIKTLLLLPQRYIFSSKSQLSR